MTRRARATLLVVVLAAGTASCGQQGPLVLPEEARPIERVEQPVDRSDPGDEDERQDER
jgi:predicted small lipoprotein YifL